MVQGLYFAQGENFCTCPDQPWGPPPIQNDPPPSTAKLKEIVGLYLYYPSLPTHHVMG